MTKTKRQLRAEAVENLKANSDWAWHDLADFFKASGLMDSPYNTPYRELRAALIDLLEDDELPEGDAVAILRKWIANHDPQLRGHGLSMLETIADMIERDYVSREVYDSLKKLSTDSDAWLKRKVDELTAERDELKAFSERLETAAHDKLGVTLFGVDYVTEDFMLHVRDTLTAERDEALEIRDNALGDAVTLKYERDELTDKIGEITDEVSELVKKQPYTFNVHDAPGSLRTVGRYIDELTAERDEWKAKAEQAQESYLDAKSDRDAWMEKAMDAHESCRQDADQPKRQEAPDCESDSREKLEADVSNWIHERRNHFAGNIGAIHQIYGWLDRQASIDERYWKSQVDALVSKGEMIADGNTRLWNEIAELQKKVDALTQANGDLRDEWHRVCGERDELRRELTNSNREREQLRKQLGIAIDHAHDMIALVSVDTDEGLA